MLLNRQPQAKAFFSQAAAELAATPRADWLGSLRADATDLRRAMRRALGDAAQTLDNLQRRLLSPTARIGQQRQLGLVPEPDEAPEPSPAGA